jgi:hypothetical protein
MTKPARTIPLRDRETIRDIHDEVKEKPLSDQFTDLKNEFRSVTRGLEYRLKLVEAENRSLRDAVAAMENGVRTPTARRNVMFSTVAACGNGGGDAG